MLLSVSLLLCEELLLLNDSYCVSALLTEASITQLVLLMLSVITESAALQRAFRYQQQHI